MPARAGMGLRPVLCARAGVHDAGVSGAALLPYRSLGAVGDHPRGARAHQVRGRDLRRGGRLRDPLARGGAARRRRHVQQLLDRHGGGRAAHRGLHGARRDAGGRVHRRPADVHPRCGIGSPHGVRARAARRLARAAPGARPGPVQPVEAHHPRRDGGHVGPGEGIQPHRLVLQRQLPVAGHAAVRADYRLVVLVYGPVHRAARPERQGRAHGAPRQHFRRVPEAVPGVHLHHSRPDGARAREDRQGPGARRHSGRAGERDRPGRSGGVSPHGEGSFAASWWRDCSRRS